MNIIFHADDFGITPEQSSLILDCLPACTNGAALNSLSVLVNSPHFEQCADMLDEYRDSVLMSLHVNIVEGHCCADVTALPLLVDEQGLFKLSFAELLFASLGRSKKELQAQIETEISAQMALYFQRFPEQRDHLRIDSHQHFHLIPAVFDAMLAAAHAQGATIEFMRIPAEPVLPFLQTPSAWLCIKPVNWVKHWLLNFLWRFDKKNLPNYPSVSAVFCGINFSGCMTFDNVSKVLPRFIRHSHGKRMVLELLFHPGGYSDPACALNPNLEGFVAFYTSENRRLEAHALKTIRTVADASTV